MTRERGGIRHHPGTVNRRALLIGTGAAVVGFGAYPYVRRALSEKQPVFLAAGQRYDKDLSRTIADGLAAVGLGPEQCKNRRVLLKPNLVEPTRACPQMTTDPRVVLAAADVFRRWGAAVQVGEGPGHVKDTEVALVESRFAEALVDGRLDFVDLNHDQIGSVENRGRASALERLFLPRAVLEADFVVSMPKLKTHHWIGMTASMKNLYGVMPGIKYGWPKNVLHHAGIPQTVLDINASLPRTLAIVDAIDCMEGDGPIMGTRKSLGVIAVAQNLPALDATLARIMDFVPQRIAYLALADGRLGPLDDRLIVQRGEDWRKLVSPFVITNSPGMDGLRANEGGIKTSGLSTPRAATLA
jgi:uncharacterized protein (DUF362 family)